MAEVTLESSVKLLVMTRFLDPVAEGPHDIPVLEIPWTAWLVAYAALTAACAYWHNRQPSKHLFLMAIGMAWVAALELPGAFSDWAGHDELTRYARFIIPDEESLGASNLAFSNPGARLIELCVACRWIGWVIFALGLRRVAKDLATHAAFSGPVLP
jgi:hypothetical protein